MDGRPVLYRSLQTHDTHVAKNITKLFYFWKLQTKRFTSQGIAIVPNVNLMESPICVYNPGRLQKWLHKVSVNQNLKNGNFSFIKWWTTSQWYLFKQGPIRMKLFFLLHTRTNKQQSHYKYT